MSIAENDLKKLEMRLNHIYLIVNEFIEEIQKERFIFPRFYNNSTEELKLAKSLLELIKSFQMYYTTIQIYEDNNLLRKLNNYNKRFIEMVSERLYNKNQVDNDLMNFVIKFSLGLKSVVKIYFPEVTDINLFYLESYVGCEKYGLNAPSNYLILKTEAISLFKYYLDRYDDCYLKNILIPVNEIILNDQNTINRKSGNQMQKFTNILKELNSLRLRLINEKENHLLLFITEIMDNAFEIVRPKKYRHWDMQNSLIINSCDPLSNKMGELQ